jgi:hypothetical protein
MNERALDYCMLGLYTEFTCEIHYPHYHLFSGWLIICCPRGHVTVRVPAAIVSCGHTPPRKEPRLHIKIRLSE